MSNTISDSDLIDHTAARDVIAKLASSLCESGISPYIVAATLLTVSLRMYRTVLTVEDFNKFVDDIPNSKDLIQPLIQHPDMKDDNCSLH
jgi:hypothetical protein